MGLSTGDYAVSPEAGARMSSDVGGGEQPFDGAERDLDSAAQAPQGSQQYVTTGSLLITAVEPLEAADEATQIVNEVGGRVDARTERAPTERDAGRAELTLRIPSAELSATIERLNELGDPEELALTSDNVTRQVQDLESRIDALRTSTDRLIDLLATAEDTEVLLKIEAALTERQAELESLEGRQRVLADQVSLSTLKLTLQSEKAATPEEPVTFVDGLVAGWMSLVAFGSAALVVIGALLPWAVALGVVGLIVFAIVRTSLRRRARRTAEDASAAEPS